MTAYQERKLSMFMVVYQYIFDTDPVLLAKMPNFVALYDQLVVMVDWYCCICYNGFMLPTLDGLS